MRGECVGLDIVGVWIGCFDDLSRLALGHGVEGFCTDIRTWKLVVEHKHGTVRIPRSTYVQ